MQNAPSGGSAILSTFFKIPFVNKIFVLSIFEWPFYTGLIVDVIQKKYEGQDCIFITLQQKNWPAHKILVLILSSDEGPKSQVSLCKWANFPENLLLRYTKYGCGRL